MRDQPEGDLSWWKTLTSSMSNLNPWHNLKVMGTNIPGDVTAGVTVAVIAMPLALAFGVASGLGPESGMWAAICGGVVVGIFGGSKVGISGPTGPKVVQLAAVLASLATINGKADVTFAFSLVLLSGVVCLGFAFLKIGRFIYYTPYSAVSGFMCGIGVIIILLEIPPILGFATPNSVWAAIQQIPYDLMHEQPQAVIVSVATFASIIIWPRISPVKWVPGPLVGLIVGTTIANVWSFKIEYIQAMSTGLPSLRIPDFTRIDEMIGPAFALAGLAIFDSLLTCLVADNMTDERHDSDREIFGQGLANIACGLVGGVTTATATMRTVANVKTGGKTGLASIVHGLVLLALMLGLAPLAALVPMACLAGILLKVGIDIIDYRVMPVLHRMPVADAICFWAVLALTISVDLLVAMGVGIAIAFVKTIHDFGHLYEQQVINLRDVESTTPKAHRLPESLKNRIQKLRLSGPLFFGVADTLYNLTRGLSNYDYLFIRLDQVPAADMSGAYLLEDIIDKAHQDQAVVMLIGASPRVHKVLQKLKIVEKVGTENCFVHVDEAVEKVCERENMPVPVEENTNQDLVHSA